MRTDSELQRDVHAELAWQPSVNAADIGVSVKDGVVMLNGHVPSYAERHAAEEAAKRVYGVRALANELEVKLPSRSERTDEDIARAAAAALECHVQVLADKIKVTVSRGWIKLEGEVEWQFQKEAAENAVRNMVGVLGVSSLITVEPRTSPTEVRSKIEEALERHGEREAKRVSVEVNDGTVILRGTVRSWMEREDAQRAAWAAPGVRLVEDLITIARGPTP